MDLLELTAGDLMVRDLVVIGRDAPLQEAAALMAAKHHHCLVVPNEDKRRFPGVVTMKDIVQVLCEGDASVVGKLIVADVMTDPAICVQRDALIHDCIRLMRASGIRSAPVLHGTSPMGILSFTDVIKRLVAG